MLIETERCGRLFVEERGKPTGPTLVLWHSLLCDGGMWEPMVRELEAQYRVVNIDAPGHGRSSPTRSAYSMDDSVDAAIAVLDHLAIARCAWIGLSWDGMVGMRLGLRVPDRLAGLALFDTSANAESRRKLPSYYLMAAIARRFGAVPLLLDRIVPIYLSAATRREQPRLVQRFRERVASMDPMSVGHAVDAVIFRRDDIVDRLREIRVPTLVVCGDDDIATPLVRSETIASAIHGAALRRIASAGHLSAWEQPAAALRHLEPWLETLRFSA
jgi:pimeloyl-ACP methyl ester carboxylesterase